MLLKIASLNKWKFAIVWTSLVNIFVAALTHLLGMWEDPEMLKFTFAIVNVYIVIGPVYGKFTGVNPMKNV